MRKLLHAISYVFWLVNQVIIAATEVIADNFRPRQTAKPVLVGLPVRLTSDLEVAVFGASITMTPGTLVCGVRDISRGPNEDEAGPGALSPANGTRLFIIHCIFGGDPEGLIESFQEMEEKITPSITDVPRPQGFLFTEYDPEVQPDPRAYIGTQRETVAPGRWSEAMVPIGDPADYPDNDKEVR